MIVRIYPITWPEPTFIPSTFTLHSKVSLWIDEFLLSFVKFSELSLCFLSAREIGDLEDFTPWKNVSVPNYPGKFTMLLYYNSWMEPLGFC
jgi:hypothetical protein